MLDPSVGGTGAEELRPEGTVVLLLMGSVDRQWAADAVIELSAEWAREGKRIVLADLHLENPLLHAGLDVSNLEGVVDIFLYGASLSRIAKPVRNGAFYFIPSGTYAPDTREIYGHPRWRKLVAGFRDTGATLILFAPAEGADLPALSQWTSETIILGPRPDPPLGQELERLGIRVLAVLEPPPVLADANPGASGILPESAPDLSTASESLGRKGDAGVAAAERPATTVHRPPDSELELPPPPVRRREERKATSILLWVLLALVVLASAAYLLFSFRPELLPRGEPGGRGESGTSLAAETVAPTPTRQVGLLPYSVQVKAFTSLTAAFEEAAAGESRLAAAPFFISPEEIQGVLYYKIFAGLSVDTLGAMELRDRLVELELADEDDVVGTSLIQFTPLTFDLGEYPTRQAAELRADSLRVQEVPAYAAAIPYSDGTQRWQLYGGAYRDSVSAEAMRERLESAGVQTRLLARAGLPATLPE